MDKLTNLTWRYLDDRHQSEGGDILETFNLCYHSVYFQSQCSGQQRKRVLQELEMSMSGRRGRRVKIF